MSKTAQAQGEWRPHVVRTHNPSTQSENRMHSDEVARAHGFKAALVPGVTVFSHMTTPLVQRFGAAWLARGVAEVGFSKPAYEGDMLTVRTAPERDTERAFTVRCHNADGIELAAMTSTLPDTASAPDARGEIAPAAPIAQRPLVSWELMEIGQPFPALMWTPSQAENGEWCGDASDDLALYREGAAPLLHPGLVLRQANNVFRHRFTLPAWIHTGSRIAFHQPLRVGSRFEVRAIPEEKWQRKGHEFVRLFVAIRCDGRTVAEVLHTAIFRPRAAAASQVGAGSA